MQINVIIDSEKINYSSATVYLVLLLDSLNLSFYSSDSYLWSFLLWNDFCQNIFILIHPFSIFDWFLKQKSTKQNQEWVYFTIMLVQCARIFFIVTEVFFLRSVCYRQIFLTRANSSAAFRPVKPKRQAGG